MYRKRPVTLLDSLDVGWSLSNSLALMRAFALSSFYDVIRIDLAGHERKGTVPVSQYATCAARSKRNLVARVHLCNRRRHGRLHRTLPGTRPTNSGIDGVVERSLFSMLLAIVGVDHTLLRAGSVSPPRKNVPYVKDFGAVY